jgi:hypothetical protein
LRPRDREVERERERETEKGRERQREGGTNLPNNVLEAHIAELEIHQQH